MEARELRIGNLVKAAKHPKDSVFEIYRIYETSVTALKSDRLYGFDIDELEPIQLTEEWLLKFGFIKVNGEWGLTPLFEVKIIVFNEEEYNGVMFYTRTIHTDFVPIYCTYNISNVHQLQNLYFALTGEELTIKQEIK